MKGSWYLGVGVPRQPPVPVLEADPPRPWSCNQLQKPQSKGSSVSQGMAPTWSPPPPAPQHLFSRTQGDDWTPLLPAADHGKVWSIASDSHHAVVPSWLWCQDGCWAWWEGCGERASSGLSLHTALTETPTLQDQGRRQPLLSSLSLLSSLFATAHGSEHSALCALHCVSWTSTAGTCRLLHCTCSQGPPGNKEP